MGEFFHMIKPGSNQEKEYIKYLQKNMNRKRTHQRMIFTKTNLKKILHN